MSGLPDIGSSMSKSATADLDGGKYGLTWKFQTSRGTFATSPD
jgi:hypothetical protein